MLYGTPVLTKLPMVTSSQRIYSLRLGIGFTSQISRRTNRLTFHWTTRRTLHSTLTPLVDVRVTLPLSVFSHQVHVQMRSEEHTSEFQSPDHIVCRLLLEKKKYHK